jgi:hypothetical protein
MEGEEEQLAEAYDGEFSATEALKNIHEPVEVIQFILVFFCLSVQRKLFHYH